jgi:DnaK suppressor protein
MREREIKKFRKHFEDQLQNLIFNDRVIREDFSVNHDDRFDEIDQATTDTEQAMRMRLCNREVLYLKKVQDALQRIEDGTFGLCEECEEPIELRRLQARPTATLCVGCKEDQERREHHSAVGRVHKSLGEAFSRKYA